MSKFTPWTQEEAEKAALSYESPYYLEDLAHGEGTLQEVEDAVQKAFLAGLAWAAAQIEKCDTVFGEKNSPVHSWTHDRFATDTHQAKLVGVREVEK